MNTTRYYATAHRPLHGWQIRDHDDERHPVDVVRSPRSAQVSVDALNAGQAHVDRHGTLGCRVVPGAAAEAAAEAAAA